MENVDRALGYAAEGWLVFPVQPRSKVPGCRWTEVATVDPVSVTALWRASASANIGVACGDTSNLIVVDVDVGTGKEGLASLKSLTADLNLPITRTCRTGSGGLHLYFSDPGGLTNSNKGIRDRYPSIDIRANGGYVVGAGSVHANGAAYEWIDETVPIQSLPDNLRALLKGGGGKAPSILSPGGVAESGRNTHLTSAAGRLRRQGHDEDMIAALLLVKNQKECNPPLDDAEVRGIARSIAKYEPEPDARFTELWAAAKAVDVFGENLRFQADTKQWLVWDSSRWKIDNTDQAKHMISGLGSTLREQSQRINDTEAAAGLRKFGNSLEKRSSINAIAELASLIPAIQVTSVQLDQHDYLLNCMNGTFDLEKDGFREHRREDLLTKRTDVTYDHVATCPRFLSFLSEIFPDDPQVPEYLRRYFGYCLSGSTQEQSILFWEGSGSNGKSVLASVLQKTLGEYGTTVAPDSFAVQNAGGTRGDLVRLVGARAVFSSESNEQIKIDEALVKRLTGGEKIVARGLYKGEIEFTPSFKIIFNTNTVPAFTADDEATWRRVRILPFRRVFKEHEKDQDLARKLIQEGPGILNWMIEGYRRWRTDGMTPPESVRAAGLEHRSNLDSVGSFISAKCRLAPAETVLSRDIFSAFTGWTVAEGLPLVTQARLGTALRRKGFVSRKSHGIKAWQGLALAQAA